MCSSDLLETQAYVLKKLDEYGIPYVVSDKDSSIIATINGGKPGKVVALRADMDALPIQEANEVDYISQHPGKMHACGHDTHTAMLLVAGKVLQEHRNEWLRQQAEGGSYLSAYKFCAGFRIFVMEYQWANTSWSYLPDFVSPPQFSRAVAAATAPATAVAPSSSKPERIPEPV